MRRQKQKKTDLPADRCGVPFLLFFHDFKILKILQFATCRDSIFSRRFTSQLKISIEIDSTIFPKVENLL